MLMQFRLLCFKLQRHISFPFADISHSKLHLVRNMMFQHLRYTMLFLSLRYRGQTAFSITLLLKTGCLMLPLQLNIKFLDYVFLYFLLH